MKEDYQWEEIPNNFHQDANGKAFCNCSFCGADLDSSGLPYMIEKVFKRNLQTGHMMTLIEYAICLECGVKKMEALSEESKENVQKYMQERMADRDVSYENFEERTSKCSITGKSTERLEEFSMVGQFLSGKMMVKEFPFVVSAEIGEDVQSLLSEQTKREFDDFLDTVTGIPPELRSLFRTKRPVLV